MRSAIYILMIWALAWILLLAIRNVLNVFKKHVIARVGSSADLRRVDTLIGVCRHAALFVIVGVAAMLSLGELGISVAPVLATASVAGIAVGFGAQSLVRDFFTGLFLLIENQVGEGEFIEAAGKSGIVEEVTLRHIRLRDDEGNIHFIPNGIITTVTNKSRDYAYAIIELNLPRRYEPDQVFSMMRQVHHNMLNDTSLAPDLLGDLDISGVEKIDDASITVRCRLKVKPLRHGHVRRQFLLRMKSVLDKSNEEGNGETPVAIQPA